MSELILQQVTQTLPLNCVSACLAMLMDRDIDKITSEFHQPYLDCELEIHQYLDKYEVPYTRLLADGRDLKPNKVYFITHPSINIEGGLHQLIAQTSEEGSWWVLDPNSGREGRRVITHYEPEEDHEFQIKGWIPIYEFDVEELLSWRKSNVS